MLRKSISVILILSMMLGIFATVSFTVGAAEADIASTGATSGPKDDLTWSLSDDGTLIISGEGAMWHYYKSEISVPWHKNRKNIKSIVIENGVTSIDEWAFAGYTSLTSVEIGDSVTSISNGTFYGCTNLVSITIPDSVTSIDEWAFAECTSLTSIRIPESVTNIENNVFPSNITLFVYSGSYAESYAVHNNIPYEYNSTLIKLIVFDDNQQKINTGYSVNWYEKGTDIILNSGNYLSVDKKEEYQFELILGEQLSYIYEQPKKQEVVIDDESNTISVQLEKLKTVLVKGKIVEKNGKTVNNVKVTFNQIFNNHYKREETVDVDSKGEFNTWLVNTPTDALITANGYYDRTKVILSGETELPELELGTITLLKLPETKITLTLTKVDATLTGKEGAVTQLSSDERLTFSLYNVTKARLIEDFTVQFPYLILNDGEIEAGDVLWIDVTDEENRMTAKRQTLCFNTQRTASCAITFTENGKFSVSSVKGNENNIVMLFDENREFIRSESLFPGYTSDALPSGSYTTVFIKKTDLLRSVSNLSKLDEVGLSEGSDYTKKTVTIYNGIITDLATVTIPFLDESKFNYTVPDFTGITANSSVINVGRYNVIRCAYRIDKKHVTSNETVIVDIPKGVSFTNGSLTVDGKKSEFNYNNGTVSINTNKNEGIIRFYVVATDKGEVNINATLSFTNMGNTVSQPIGSATFTVDAGSIAVPKKTSQKSVSITGTTLSDSTVTIFDNGTCVGITKANKAGNWILTFDLDKPYNRSYHSIYAQIENTLLSDPIVTDAHILFYQTDFAEVSRVTMINTAHPENNLNAVEYTTVFNFFENSTATPSYRYWPKYPTFTFKVEFVGNTANLSDVYAVTTDSSGEETYVLCQYDSTSGFWIGTHDYRSSSKIPVSLEVIYNADELQTLCDNPEYDELRLEDIESTYKSVTEDLISASDELVLLEVLEEADDYCIIELTDQETSTVLSYATYIYCDYEAIENGLNYTRLSEESDWYCAVVEDNASIIYYMKNDANQTAFVYIVVPCFCIFEQCTKEEEEVSKALAPILSRQTYRNISDLAPTGTSNLSDNIQTLLDRTSKIANKKAKEQLEGWKAAGLIIDTDHIQAIETIKQALDIVEQISNIEDAFDRICDSVGYYQMRSVIMQTKIELLDSINNLEPYISAKCPNGSYKLSSNDISKYTSLKEYLYSFTEEQMGSVMETLDHFRSELLWSSIHKLSTIGLNAISSLKATNGFKFGKRVTVNSKNARMVGYFFNQRERAALSLIAKGNHYYNLAQETIENYKILSQAEDAFFDTTESLYGDNIVNDYIEVKEKLDEVIDYIDNKLDSDVNVGLEEVRTAFNGVDALIRQDITSTQLRIIADYNNCDTDNNNNNDKKRKYKNHTYKKLVKPILDPSGYVYEAVPSNRVRGVKAEIYYYDYDLDDFGISAEEKSNIIWDAENYDQVNPIYTDASGEYAWDVPLGQWLVKFSKDGYYDTDSKSLSMVDDEGYLPVPPPQTEVNVGIVSKAAPTVESISVYDEEIRIEFSQYMQIDSVNNNTVTVKMNGKVVNGTITPVNSEYDYDQEHQYASIFTFVPITAISGKINMTINNVVNYAGTKMASSFTESNQVVVKPESLVIKDEISIVYNSGALLEIDVLPKEAGVGLTLDVSSSSPSIVGIANSNIVTDANGHANIMLLGNLPGEGEITVSLNGTDITKTVKASVAGVVPVNDRCEKVTANIKSGKTVESGTMIELSTTTEGAEIYYTLDGTCPCTVDSPSRIKYTEPICIKEDTFIIAYAVKDGMQESYTAGFNYFVPDPISNALLGDVDGDGTVTIIDATYIQRQLASIPIPFEFNDTVADTDGDGSVTIIDATYIQRWLAALPSNDKIGQPIS